MGSSSGHTGLCRTKGGCNALPGTRCLAPLLAAPRGKRVLVTTAKNMRKANSTLDLGEILMKTIFVCQQQQPSRDFL